MSVFDEKFYVYVLQSQKDGNFYVGYTNDIELRFEQHLKGAVESTKNRLKSYFTRPST
ncbi:MAG: GIY-YIG nuclease family protein [bacterium]|nr:GIY-YIG nuclease family protein [bacterium]